MARITFSPLITDARGKVGDTVFSKWKGINYIRTRVTPANPNTAAQQNTRDKMAQAVSVWQYLDSAVKAAWNRYGATLGISGFNAFTKKNLPNLISNNDFWWSLPPSDDIDMLANVTVDSSVSNSLVFGWDDPSLGEGYYAVLTAIKKDAPQFYLFATDIFLSLETYTYGALTPGDVYDCSAAVIKTADGLFSTPVTVTDVTITA